MYIAIDVGATNVRIAGSKKLEHFSFDKIERFELSHNFENDFTKITEIIKKISDGNIEAIGIGAPGTFNEEKKILISATNLPEWVNVFFVEKLAEEFNCPVYADNDGVVASLGEFFYGKNKQKDFLYITWGTGIGGSQVKSNVNEIISQRIEWPVYLKEFEEKCGGKKIIEKYNKVPAELNEEEWEKLLEDFVFHLIELTEKFSEKNIVMGGGATSKQKKRLEMLVENLAEKGVNLVISNLDDSIGLFGAMSLIQLNK